MNKNEKWWFLLDLTSMMVVLDSKSKSFVLNARKAFQHDFPDHEFIIVKS